MIMMMMMMMFDNIDNNSYSVGGDITFPNFSKKYFSAPANCICKVQEEGRGGGVQCPAFPLLEAFPIRERGMYCYLSVEKGKVAQNTLYESFSDVGEIRVWFASKILTPCRMH